MRCRACLNAHQARRKISEECCNLPALQLSPHDDTATGIDAVNLQHSLRKIETNRGNLHVGRLLPCGVI
jgi:hypothetical protein